jgi:hypothetical protein
LISSQRRSAIRLYDAGIDREALTLHQTSVHARPHNSLEYLPKGIALTEAAMTIDRECRMIRDLVVEVEATEPAIGKVKLDLLAQAALGTDAVAVADDQHPDHEFRVDRGPADLAVEGLQPLANVGQYPCHRRIDTAQKMARWSAGETYACCAPSSPFGPKK